MRIGWAAALASIALLALPAVSQEAGHTRRTSRLAYLSELCDPYYVSRAFPKLTTPQWVGEEGVDAVVVLAIDDMRKTEPYEAYLRPILDRLKRIDGRAPVSIMTCSVDPMDPRLAKWLAEGLSIETHTFDHPCPMLAKGDLAAAKATYDQSIDLVATIPGNAPVAFRTPCCDSQNTPGPRLFSEIVLQTTPSEQFLSLDSSVFVILTADDPELPREVVLENERERFRKYVPSARFANLIENYPYPYVIGGGCWEFPCIVPSDWQGQKLSGVASPTTLLDLKAALDGVVAKQGVFDLVFHPYGWISNEQVVELVDYADRTYGKRVKFLTFREAHDRLCKNLLGGTTLRSDSGIDNGVRLLDLNDDAYLDVVIANDHAQQTRLWRPNEKQWSQCGFPLRLASHADGPVPCGNNMVFGIVGPSDQTVTLDFERSTPTAWRWTGSEWESEPALMEGLSMDGQSLRRAATGKDAGIRLRDIDGDGTDELIVGRPGVTGVFRWMDQELRWRPLPFSLPNNVVIVDALGRDAGLRFQDLDGDGGLDVIFSDDDSYSVDRFVSMQSGWSHRARGGDRSDPRAIPPIVRGGTNNGAFFHSRAMWVQNEGTDLLPDLIDRRSYEELLKP